MDVNKHHRLIRSAQNTREKCDSVTRKMIYGSDAASLDLLQQVTIETDAALSDLRAYEDAHVLLEKRHIMELSCQAKDMLAQSRKGMSELSGLIQDQLVKAGATIQLMNVGRTANARRSHKTPK